MQTNPADEQSNIQSWPLNVVKRVILLSEFLSVRPSDCCTHDPRLNGSRYRNTLHIMRQSHRDEFWNPEFRGFAANERHPLSTANTGPIICHIY